MNGHARCMATARPALVAADDAQMVLRTVSPITCQLFSLAYFNARGEHIVREFFPLTKTKSHRLPGQPWTPGPQRYPIDSFARWADVSDIGHDYGPRSRSRSHQDAAARANTSVRLP